MAKKVALFASPFDTSPLVLAGQSAILAKQQIVSPVRPPSPFQQQIIDCNSDLALVGGRGGGKEMPISEPVLTPSGWRTMGEIAVGSFVVGSSGQSCKVLQIHPQGIKDVYLVSFKDGTSVRCGLDHLWGVVDLKNKYRVYSVKELLEMGVTRLHSGSSTGLRYKFSVEAFNGKLMGGVNAPHSYALGYLLGNAHFQQGMLRVTCHSKYSDLLVELLAPSLGQPNKKSSYVENCTQINYSWQKVDPLIAAYRGSGLSGDKGLLPQDDYLSWNFDSRLALLQGLLDSDGTLGKCESGNDRQKLSFFSTSEKLIELATDLVRSIGGRCCEPRRDKREYNSGYGAEINFRVPANPFRLRSQEWSLPKYSMRASITDIKKLDYQEESKCITIDSYDQLYVTAGWKLTHNSFGVALRIANRVNKYKRQYRGLYLRKTYEGLEDFEEVCQDVFRLHCPGSYNISKKAWRFDNGGFLKFGQLELDKHYRKYIGKSFMELYVDEAGQFADPILLDRLLSNIRGPKGVPFSRTILSNPGDVGHWWIYNRYIKDKKIGVAYQDPDCDRTVITLQSTYRDNPHQNNEEYQSMLLSSTANDEELRRAYIDGDWRISRGSFFATVLDEARSKIEPWATVPHSWKKFLGMDYGTAAPCPIYMAAISPGAAIGDQYYPKDSIVLLDELYLANGQHKGLNLTIDQAAQRIKDFCLSWNHDPLAAQNIADDACFASDGRDSIAALFLKAGVRFSPAKKGDRLSGWEHMRTMLRCAGDLEEPGLYISSLCLNFWAVLPSVARCARNPSDVDTKGNDHIADAVRYLCLVVRRDKGQQVYASSFAGDPL